MQLAAVLSLVPTVQRALDKQMPVALASFAALCPFSAAPSVTLGLAARCPGARDNFAF